MKFTTFVRFSSITFFILLAGCASLLKSDVKLEATDSDSVIIMGIEPDARLNFTRGWNRSDGWHADKFQIFPHYAKSNSGYVVVRIPGSSNKRNYGLTFFKARGIMNKGHSPCGNQETITFDAPAGSVVFIGDFSLISGDSNPANARGIEKARQYLEANYPRLAPRLIEGSAEFQSVANIRCPRWYDYLNFPIVF